MADVQHEGDDRTGTSRLGVPEPIDIPRLRDTFDAPQMHLGEPEHRLTVLASFHKSKNKCCDRCVSEGLAEADFELGRVADHDVNSFDVIH